MINGENLEKREIHPRVSHNIDSNNVKIADTRGGKLRKKTICSTIYIFSVKSPIVSLRFVSEDI